MLVEKSFAKGSQGKVGASYGEPGSVRIDVMVIDPTNRAVAILDFKFGGASLTKRRTKELLDAASRDSIPVIPIRLPKPR